MVASTTHTRILDQIAQFLHYVAVTALLFAALELLGGWAVGSPAVMAVGASMIVFGGALLGTRHVLRGGASVLAGGLAALSFLVAPLIFVAALPALLPVGCFFLLAACSLPMLFRSRRLFVVVAAAATAVALLLAAISLMPPLLTQPPFWVVAAFRLSNLPVCTALMGLLFYFIWQNFTASVDATEAANTELRTLQVSLADQVRERTCELRSALDEVEARAAAQETLLAENRRQRDAIQNLSVPVLPIGAGTLVMPLIGALDAERLETLLGRALDAISALKARRLVLDITGVALIDAEVAAGLWRVPQAARLLGCEVILVGVRPEVAQTVVGLGLHLVDVRSASTLEDLLVRPAVTAR